MIRIVGIQRSARLEEEFILLQNQSSMRQNLRGHALMNESARMGDLAKGMFQVLTDDEMIGPGQFVLVRTGSGAGRWGTSRDGTKIYNTFLGLPRAVWGVDHGPVHILKVEHSYCERMTASMSV